MASVRDELMCSVCLELYTDPVTLPCGHNFCRACIERYLDTCHLGGHSCPDCRAHFPRRPELQKNITLCNVVLHFRSAQNRETGGMYCTYCIRSTAPAVMACLHCEASLCEDHLRVHSTAPEHILTQPRSSQENKKCSTHNEILTHFCMEDSVCICESCRVEGEHQGHHVESLDEASEKKKTMMRDVLQTMIQEKEENEKKIRKLWEQRRVIKEQQASLAMSELIRQLELKKMELSRRIDHVTELCEVTDSLTVLLDQQSNIWSQEEKNPEDLYQDVTAEGEDLDIIFDLNTAANNLRVSPDLKTLWWSKAFQRRPETPARFQSNQVFSAQSFSSGRHSWDVETSEYGDWRIGVAYQSMVRQGDQSYAGDNHKSWCLRKLYQNQYSVIHGGDITTKVHKFSCYKFRICLDYEAGQISFYELSDPIQLLHTFTTIFIEPVRAVFGVGYWLGSDESFWLRVGNIGT